MEIGDIQQAAERAQGVVRDLPVQGARWLSDQLGGPVYLIPENLQRAGSFKIRGAYNRIAQLSDDERAKGVVAASAGNHAQGVALAGQLLGVAVTVFMPVDASIPKIEATRGYGADVRFHGTTVDEALVEARAFADETGAILIHPFDHEHVVAGQGTLGLEIVEKIPDVKTVVVCTGGGGLLAGVAFAVKQLKPDVKVIGVQAEGAATYPQSLAAGAPQTREQMNTMADGIAIARPGDVPFELVQEYVDEFRTVSEDELSRAVLMLLERAKLVVEPSGAAATAAVMNAPRDFEPPVAITISGGNVDSLVLLRIIRHGMAAAGRYLSISVHTPDFPGSLAGLLEVLKQHKANVVDVFHDRTDPRVSIGDVRIDIQMETRSTEQRDQILSALRSSGYHVEVLDG
ncbi:MAG TPA: threonine ammonia-lyase [Candidatus Nanopelagicales bacterium]|nr:threonine ammonia-lyase [Candidatus Nanopelagicales bacterium]